MFVCGHDNSDDFNYYKPPFRRIRAERLYLFFFYPPEKNFSKDTVFSRICDFVLFFVCLYVCMFIYGHDNS